MTSDTLAHSLTRSKTLLECWFKRTPRQCRLPCPIRMRISNMHIQEPNAPNKRNKTTRKIVYCRYHNHTVAHHQQQQPRFSYPWNVKSCPHYGWCGKGQARPKNREMIFVPQAMMRARRGKRQTRNKWRKRNAETVKRNGKKQQIDEAKRCNL